MLEELIREVRASDALQPTVLAERLHTSPAMVEAMLENLERMGKLHPISADCGQACCGCPLAGSCLPSGGRGRLWLVSPGHDLDNNDGHPGSSG